MIQYIYFVKCPDCEDEPFDFFRDAEAFALGCLDKKPIITQVEINRNDFGECTDSCDLGTIWSWENLMDDSNAEPLSLISKYETVNKSFGSDMEDDPEFAALDNSVDVVNGIPIPEGMTIEDLVEELEENEDEVECAWCEELFDKGDCRREVDLGWLCPQCEAAIKSRGEPLTFTEGSLEESISSNETVDLEYDELTITLTGNQRDADDWDEVEYTDRFTYSVDKDEIATVIWENFITEEDAASVPGGLDTLEDEAAWNDFLENHFDELFEKYYNNLLEHYREYAIEAFEDSYSWSDYMSDLALNKAEADYEYNRDQALLDAMYESTTRESKTVELTVLDDTDAF